MRADDRRESYLLGWRRGCLCWNHCYQRGFPLCDDGDHCGVDDPAISSFVCIEDVLGGKMGSVFDNRVAQNLCMTSMNATSWSDLDGYR